MDWQPIETAPKERKHKLLFGDGGNFSRCIFIGFFADYAGHQWADFNGNCNVYPTHWMPLPEAPSV